MARPFNPDLTKYWKICLPATLAGTVELYLMDNIHKKPKYGSRAQLITGLLETWVAEQKKIASGESFAPPEPVRVKAVTREIAGYEYQIARVSGAGGLGDWHREMSPVLPNVPKDRIRNITPLYRMNDKEPVSV